MAFGASSVLDNFNRTAEDPLSGGGNWTNQIRSGDDDLRTNGTQAYTDYAAQQASAWWDIATFGAACEVYITVATKPADSGRATVLCRLASPGTGNCDGYLAVMRDTGVTTQGIYRYDNDVQTLLGAAVTPTWANGDKLGIEAIGSTIKMYQYTGGSWSELASRSDSTYSAAGYIGFDTGVDSTRFDDFGGGTVSTGTTVTPTAASCIARTSAPTVRLGSLSVTTVAAGALARVTNPAVRLGSLSITPVVAAAVARVTDPTVLITGGGTTVTPAAAACIASTSAPLAVQGSLSVAAGPAGALASVSNPVALLGSLSLTPGVAAAIVSVMAPTVVVVGGGTIVTPVAAGCIASVAAPSVELGDLAVIPAAAGAIARVANPTVLVGGGGAAETLKRGLYIGQGL